MPLRAFTRGGRSYCAAAACPEARPDRRVANLRGKTRRAPREGQERASWHRHCRTVPPRTMRAMEKPNLPSWLKWVNPIVTFLNRRGLPIGPMEVLTTTGRTSGKPISNPISVLPLDGERHICTVCDVSWVLNARLNPRVALERGRRKYTARLVEVPESDRTRILREFPVKIPDGVAFFRRALGISGTPESFEQAADRCRVFRIEA